MIAILPSYTTLTIFNEEPILSAINLNNHALCRNKAPMLTEIYKHFGIESQNVICVHHETAKRIVLNLDEFLTKEDKEKLEKQENAESMIKELENMLERINKEIIEKEFKDYDNSSAHCLNLVNGQEHSYLLDLATLSFYTDKDEDGRYYSNRGNYFKVIDRKFKNPFKKTMTTKLEIPHPLKDSKELVEELNKRQAIIADNRDIIENMHMEIAPLLYDAEQTYKLIFRAR